MQETIVRFPPPAMLSLYPLVLEIAVNMEEVPRHLFPAIAPLFWRSVAMCSKGVPVRYKVHRPIVGHALSIASYPLLGDSNGSVAPRSLSLIIGCTDQFPPVTEHDFYLRLYIRHHAQGMHQLHLTRIVLDDEPWQ